MRIVTDRDRCMGAGQCALHAPEIFDQSDEDGTVVLHTDAPPADQHDAVRLAARMCPNQVIALHEDTVANAAGADAASSVSSTSSTSPASPASSAARDAPSP